MMTMAENIDSGSGIVGNEMSKTVFLTHDEAEKALKEGEQK